MSDSNPVMVLINHRRTCHAASGLLALLAFCGSAPLLIAQRAERSQGAPPVFRAESSLITVSFHVERNKKFVGDLNPGDILLLEDGVPRAFPVFEGGYSRALPLDIMLLFDTGFNNLKSYSPDITKLQAAFLDRLAYARLAIYGFENLLMPLCPPTRDPKKVQKGLDLAAKYLRENEPVRGEPRRLSKPPEGSFPVMPSLLKSQNVKRSGGSEYYPALVAAAREAVTWRGEATRAIVIFGHGGNGMRAQELASYERKYGWRPEVRIQPAEAIPLVRELGVHVLSHRGHARLDVQTQPVP